MIIVTPAAQRQLLQLIAAHPEDPLVRLSVKDLDHARIAFSITLESEPHADDQVQNLDGMQIAVEGRSAARLDGITIDYEEPGGFRFLHPENADQDTLGVINLN
jgi:Fe-S cluster assembly iron-binding protein IscA